MKNKSKAFTTLFITIFLISACNEQKEDIDKFLTIKEFTIGNELHKCPSNHYQSEPSANNFICSIPSSFMNTDTDITVKVNENIISKISLTIKESESIYTLQTIKSELVSLYGAPTKTINKDSKDLLIWYRESDGAYTGIEFRRSKISGKSFELVAELPLTNDKKMKIRKFIFPQNDM